MLRPEIERQIDADIALLHSLATLVERTHPRADKIRPREVVAEIEGTLSAELDLQREGANASVLRRFWEGSDDLYVPEVIWSHTAERALTLERVYGIPSDDIAKLDAAGHRPQGAGGQGRARVLHPGVPRQLLPCRCARWQHLGRFGPGAPPQSALHRVGFRHHGPALAGRSVLPGRELHGDLPQGLSPHGRVARRGRLDAVERAHRRTGSGRALGVRAVFHPAPVGNFAGAGADQIVPRGAAL